MSPTVRASISGAVEHDVDCAEAVTPELATALATVDVLVTCVVSAVMATVPVSCSHVVHGAGGRLLRLLRGRQRLFEQAGQAGEAVIGRVERLLRLADLVEERAQVVGAVGQRLRGEVGGRIVEGGVDLLAGRETAPEWWSGRRTSAAATAGSAGCRRLK